MSQKEEVVQIVGILQKADTVVSAHYDPNGGCGFAGPENQVNAIQRAVDWLDRYLKREAIVRVRGPRGPIQKFAPALLNCRRAKPTNDISGYRSSDGEMMIVMLRHEEQMIDEAHGLFQARVHYCSS